jgi:methylated-DNA-[protein]-cysteine S-methyltransferase
MRYRIIDTTTGAFALMEDDSGLRSRWIDSRDDLHLRGGTMDDALRPDVFDRLEAYFAGEVVDFDDVPTPGGSPFYRRCWAACRAIPRGSTISYADLALEAGSPGAARAAGQAMRNNPLPVIVPCHRVRAANGGIGGFAGSVDLFSPDLRRKVVLLEIEGVLVEPAASDELFVVG